MTDPLPISRFDYELPPELIAQEPLEPRDSSRLLVVERESGTLEDAIFRDLPDLLRPGDLLVINDTRVRSARLHVRRRSGAKIEILLLQSHDADWLALARPARRLQEGDDLEILDAEGNDTGKMVRFLGRHGDQVIIKIPDESVIATFGRMPLPPYIHQKLDDSERYQTVYAQTTGSAAAPTAGLHFTPELLQRCTDAGIGLANVTLHVGLDTFSPIRGEDARQHKMHAEWYRVPDSTLSAIAKAREADGRIIGVGTTAVRTLETIARRDEFDKNDSIELSGWSELFVTPPFDFKLIDGMITNFHLPRTTLLLMVSALAGETLINNAYQHAIEQRYRFYSFGDAMLIV